MRDDHFVLFLDCWGTASRAEDPLKSQTHFAKTLRELSLALPTVQVFHVADIALAYSNDVNALLSLGASAFKRMLIHDHTFTLWPLRAGIAKGRDLGANDLATSGNFFTSGILGRGNVESARLEKSGQKGMRFFLTPEVAAQVSEPWLMRPCATKGFEHFELNWMGDDVVSANFLASDFAGRELRTVLMENARRLLETNDNYSQQMGSSLLDLLKWSAKA
jgi:hypothetical protein